MRLYSEKMLLREGYALRHYIRRFIAICEAGAATEAESNIREFLEIFYGIKDSMLQEKEGAFPIYTTDIVRTCKICRGWGFVKGMSFDNKPCICNTTYTIAYKLYVREGKHVWYCPFCSTAVSYPTKGAAPLLCKSCGTFLYMNTPIPMESLVIDTAKYKEMERYILSSLKENKHASVIIL